MSDILLVKITSMGDLIQMLPALTDAQNAIPGFKLDWVIDESFVEVAKLHPAVNNIITLPYRRWKKNILYSLRSGEVQPFLRALRHKRYDMVIDAQSNLKSAFVTSFAKGKKYGLDKTSVREYGAHWAYSKKITINRQQNHAQRMRQLMATYLGYELPNTIADYGIQQDKLPSVDFSLPQRFIILTAIASRTEKLWPEPYWKEVITHILNLGYDIILPWWSEEEKARALRLQQQHSKVHLLPPMNLTQKASVLSKATALIGVDTGLSHLAAALNKPNVALYGSTSAILTGTVGQHQVHISASGPSCAPCLRTRCNYQGESTFKPACLETIKPKQVILALDELLSIQI